MNDPERSAILEAVRSYADKKHRSPHFVPGVTPIPASGKVIGAAEIANMVEASLDGWLTTGRFNAEFEKALAACLDTRFALTTNSGSSANLLAITALTSPKLGKRALVPGDEIITAAAGFPTTINPIIQNGLIPVFVDTDIPTYNPSPLLVEAAITKKTRAIVLAHTLGNPFEAEEIRRLADQHDLWLIEDCCDALGATHKGKPVGGFGHIGTLSFYPAHHITMGEGGAVFTSDPLLKRIIESFRDWGRDCWCEPGCDNSCGKRFDRKSGALPEGYDHKYTYSHLGYNLKITDMQAACALAQLNKLPAFIEKRRSNFNYINRKLNELNNFLILPEASEHSSPSWFGYPITIKKNKNFKRIDLIRHLEQHKIGTRLLFAGDITKQPYMSGRNFRVSGSLINTDSVMHDTFWIGLWPGLSEEMLDFSTETIRDFLENHD